MTASPDKRVTHACFKTKGLPRPWEATNDGRWMHVDHGAPFADRVEDVTCPSCLWYIDADRKATTS
jgi:hypothetical protein